MKREYKGYLATFLPDSYVVIDLETTGFSPSRDEIIEFAAVKVVDGKEIAYFQELAKPLNGVSDRISCITNITNEMLGNARPQSEVYKDFIEFIGDSVLVGHNVNFDVNFLYDYGLPEKVVSNDYVDTLRLAKAATSKALPCYKLGFLCELLKLNEEESGYHRALFDCRQTNKLYRALKEHTPIECWQLDAEDANAARDRYAYDEYKEVQRHTYYCPPEVSKTAPTVNLEEVDRENPFFEKNVVFTGELSLLGRKDAAQIVVNLGGNVKASVSRRTNIVVAGQGAEFNSKMIKAKELVSTGVPIEIVSENDFYALVNERTCYYVEGCEESGIDADEIFMDELTREYEDVRQQPSD